MARLLPYRLLTRLVLLVTVASVAHATGARQRRALGDAAYVDLGALLPPAAASLNTITDWEYGGWRPLRVPKGFYRRIARNLLRSDDDDTRPNEIDSDDLQTSSSTRSVSYLAPALEEFLRSAPGCGDCGFQPLIFVGNQKGVRRAKRAASKPLNYVVTPQILTSQRSFYANVLEPVRYKPLANVMRSRFRRQRRDVWAESQGDAAATRHLIGNVAIGRDVKSDAGDHLTFRLSDELARGGRSVDKSVNFARVNIAAAPPGQTSLEQAVGATSHMIALSRDRTDQNSLPMQLKANEDAAKQDNEYDATDSQLRNFVAVAHSGNKTTHAEHAQRVLSGADLNGTASGAVESSVPNVTSQTASTSSVAASVDPISNSTEIHPAGGDAEPHYLSPMAVLGVVKQIAEALVRSKNNVYLDENEAASDRRPSDKQSSGTPIVASHAVSDDDTAVAAAAPATSSAGDAFLARPVVSSLDGDGDSHSLQMMRHLSETGSAATVPVTDDQSRRPNVTRRNGDRRTVSLSDVPRSRQKRQSWNPFRRRPAASPPPAKPVAAGVGVGGSSFGFVNQNIPYEAQPSISSFSFAQDINAPPPQPLPYPSPLSPVGATATTAARRPNSPSGPLRSPQFGTAHSSASFDKRGQPFVLDQAFSVSGTQPPPLASLAHSPLDLVSAALPLAATGSSLPPAAPVKRPPSSHSSPLPRPARLPQPAAAALGAPTTAGKLDSSIPPPHVIDRIIKELHATGRIPANLSPETALLIADILSGNKAWPAPPSSVPASAGVQPADALSAMPRPPAPVTRLAGAPPPPPPPLSPRPSSDAFYQSRRPQPLSSSPSSSAPLPPRTPPVSSPLAGGYGGLTGGGGGRGPPSASQPLSGHNGSPPPVATFVPAATGHDPTRKKVIPSGYTDGFVQQSSPERGAVPLPVSPAPPVQSGDAPVRPTARPSFTSKPRTRSTLRPRRRKKPSATLAPSPSDSVSSTAIATSASSFVAPPFGAKLNVAEKVAEKVVEHNEPHSLFPREHVHIHHHHKRRRKKPSSSALAASAHAALGSSVGASPAPSPYEFDAHLNQPAVSSLIPPGRAPLSPSGTSLPGGTSTGSHPHRHYGGGLDLAVTQSDGEDGYGAADAPELPDLPRGSALGFSFDSHHDPSSHDEKLFSHSGKPPPQPTASDESGIVPTRDDPTAGGALGVVASTDEDDATANADDSSLHWPSRYEHQHGHQEQHHQQSDDEEVAVEAELGSASRPHAVTVDPLQLLDEEDQDDSQPPTTFTHHHRQHHRQHQQLQPQPQQPPQQHRLNHHSQHEQQQTSAPAAGRPKQANESNGADISKQASDASAAPSADAEYYDDVGQKNDGEAASETAGLPATDELDQQQDSEDGDQSWPVDDPFLVKTSESGAGSSSTTTTTTRPSPAAGGASTVGPHDILIQDAKPGIPLLASDVGAVKLATKHDHQQPNKVEPSLPAPVFRPEAHSTTKASDDESAKRKQQANQDEDDISAGAGAIHFQAIQTSDQNSNGSSKTGNAQLYHAYYAPAHHAPPPGYIRMTVDEFNKLFKDAEIQFIGSEQELQKKLGTKPTNKLNFDINSSSSTSSTGGAISVGSPRSDDEDEKMDADDASKAKNPNKIDNKAHAA